MYRTASSRYRPTTALILIFVAAINVNAIDFDITFGNGGKFMTAFGDSTAQPSSGGSQVFVQPAGRIVVVGTHTQQGISLRTSGFGMAGLTSIGTLDVNFGTAGKVLEWNADSHSFHTRSLMLPDGSILVLYQRWQSVSSNRPVLARYTPNGQPDTNFVADLDLFANETRPEVMASGIGGKIYVIVRRAQQFYLVRLNPNGSRDETFGTDGVRSLNLNRFGSGVAVFSLHELENGKLLIAGRYDGVQFDSATFVARFDSDTNIDRSFGLQGAVRISIPFGSAFGITTKIQSDGKIVVAGCWTFLGSNTLLIRLTARGRLDATFGERGIAMTSFNNTNVIHGITVGLDGKITVVGSSGEKAFPSNQRLFVMRYTPAGVRETFLVTNFITTREAGALDVLLQGDNKILVAGFTQNPTNSLSQLAVARFLP